MTGRVREERERGWGDRFRETEMSYLTDLAYMAVGPESPKSLAQASRLGTQARYKVHVCHSLRTDSLSPRKSHLFVLNADIGFNESHPH